MAYHQGNGVSENFKAATTWYLKAARQGSPKGQHNMGVMYMHGLGIEQNYKKSAYWYKLAALNGVDESQHNLASYYSLGRGVNLDYFKSYMWAHVADLNGYKLSKTIKMLLITKLKRKDRKQAKSRAEECFNSRYSRC